MARLRAQGGVSMTTPCASAQAVAAGPRQVRHFDPLIRQLRAERLHRDMTLAEVGARSGYTAQQICQWETGARRPRLFGFVAWCNALDFNVTLVKGKAVKP